MAMVRHDWQPTDLRFVVDALVPERHDPEHVVNLLREDSSLLQAMLEDDRLFNRLMDEDDTSAHVSPLFLFRVLLLRARRDMEREWHTVVQQPVGQAARSDAHRILELLARGDVRDYLAWLLAAFTHVETETVPIRIRPGAWRRIPVNDLDIDSLLLYGKAVEPDHRFGVYRRTADACLFLAGVFPDYIEPHRFFPRSPEPSLRLASMALQSMDDLEGYGRTFYRLAAQHPDAEQHGLADVLLTLSNEFVLAEKPLAFITQRYLAEHRHRLFPIESQRVRLATDDCPLGPPNPSGGT